VGTKRRRWQRQRQQQQPRQQLIIPVGWVKRHAHLTSFFIVLLLGTTNTYDILVKRYKF
jgi:hypothetical protein